MIVVEELPLTCAHCHKATPVAVNEAQLRKLIRCGHCGASIGIDKDAASCTLAELELGSSTPRSIHPDKRSK